MTNRSGGKIMGRWWQPAAAAAAGIVVGLVVGALFLGGGERSAMVDVDRIFAESGLAKSYNEKLSQEAQARDAELAKIANAQQRAAQAEKFRRELTKLQTDYRAEVLKKTDAVLATLAKRRKVETVFVRGGAVRLAGIDLTDEALKLLDK